MKTPMGKPVTRTAAFIGALIAYFLLGFLFADNTPLTSRHGALLVFAAVLLLNNKTEGTR